VRRRTWIRIAGGAAAYAAAGADLPLKPLDVRLGAEQTIARGVPWPYLVHLRDGTSVVLAHVRWPEGEKYPIRYTAVSRDGRRTWAEWKPPAALGAGPNTEGAAVELRDGRLLVFNVHAEHQGNKLFETDYWESRDSYRTLTGPRKFRFSVPEAETQGKDDRGEVISRLYFRRSVIELPGGDLLACAYGRFETDKAPVEYLGAMTKMRSLLLRSSDGGAAWRMVSTIAADPLEQEGAAEPAMVQLTRGPLKGRIICVLRTGRENPIYQCESDDEGRTWTRAYPLSWQYSRYGRRRDIVGTDPDIIEMADGTLAMSYGHKPDFEDHGNFLAFSTDQGRSWIQETRLSSSVTMAYTGVREVAPGELYVVYTVSDLSDSAHYRGAVFTTVGRAVTVKPRAAVAAASLVWSEQAPMPRAQAGGAAMLVNRTMVVAGGTAWENGEKVWLRDVQLFDASSGVWRKGPELPEAQAYGPSAGLEIFSGSRTIWRLDPQLRGWSKAGETPGVHLLGRAVRVGERVFLFGGCKDVVDLTTCGDAVWLRERDGGTWREVAKLPAGKVALSAAALVERTVYLFGGCSMPEPGKVVNHAGAYAFDTETFLFRRLRDLPAPNRGLTAAGVAGRVLLFGGYASEFVADVLAYDPARDTYVAEAPMPLAMSSAEFVVDGHRLIAAGGEDRMKHRSARTIVATWRGV
jgi:hypothetical protein